MEDNERFFESKRLNAIHSTAHEATQYVELSKRIKAGDEEAEQMRDRFVTVYKRVERIEEAKENKEAPKKARKKKQSYLKRHTGAAKIQENQKHLSGYTMLDFALFEDDHRDI